MLSASITYRSVDPFESLPYIYSVRSMGNSQELDAKLGVFEQRASETNNTGN